MDIWRLILGVRREGRYATLISACQMHYNLAIVRLYVSVQIKQMRYYVLLSEILSNLLIKKTISWLWLHI